MPSLPATDDGSGRLPIEDLSTGSDDGEDIAWDADTAEAVEVPVAAWTASGTHPAGAEPRDIKWAGVADGFRVPKPGAAIYQAQGDPAVRPVIVPVFFWEAAGAVSAPDQTAMIASNCERLEVFIGGLGAVWIRSLAGQPGAITPTASHPLLGQAEVQVRSAAVNNPSELG